MIYYKIDIILVKFVAFYYLFAEIHQILRIHYFL